MLASRALIVLAFALVQTASSLVGKSSPLSICPTSNTLVVVVLTHHTSHYKHMTMGIVQTPTTRAALKIHARGKDPVQSGGWYALEKEVSNELGKVNFASFRSNLPSDFSAVQAGGWYAVQQASADPKGLLLQVMQQQLTGDSSTVSVDEQQYSSELLYALVGLLQAQGKGFDSSLVDGDWTLVFQRQGQKSPKFQKLVATKETAGNSDAPFDVSKLEFYGIVRVFKGLGVLKSKVAYRPVATNFERMANSKKVVLRRIACDIVGASWKFWKLPTVALPLRKKGGYLDFAYLDGDVRITTGSRGGLFVHARPACVKRLIHG
jgi:hypothetical protein